MNSSFIVGATTDNDVCDDGERSGFGYREAPAQHRLNFAILYV